MSVGSKETVINCQKTRLKYYRFKARLFLHYYITSMKYIIIVSIGICMVFLMSELIRDTAVAPDELIKLLQLFLNMVPTYGTIGGIYLYHRFRRHEYFFFYNRGIKISILIILTFTLNILIFIVFQLFMQIFILGDS